MNIRMSHSLAFENNHEHGVYYRLCVWILLFREQMA